MIKRLSTLLVVIALVFATSAFTVFAEDDVTVYYYNSDGWDSVSVYVWEPNEQFGGWPGEECEDIGDGWWSVVLPVYEPGNHIIFNNSGGGSQNSDLYMEEGMLYFYGSRDSDEGMLTYEEAVDLFGSAPGGAVAVVETVTETEIPAQTNPPTGGGKLIFVAFGLLALSGCAFVLLSRKQRV